MPKPKALFLNQSKNLAFIKKGVDIATTKVKTYHRDKETNIFKKIFIFVLSVNLALIGVVITLRKKLPLEIPLFYGLPEGEEQLTKNIFLIVPAVFAIIFSIINILILIPTKDRFTKGVLIYSLIFISFLSLVSIVKIIFLVGNV